jgi:hypothetical protein
MNNTIDIQLDTTPLPPGGTLSGHASWELEHTPKKVEIRLFWYTSGKGTEDVERIDTIELDGSRADQRAFSFVLPLQPYSFVGSLVSLQWGIEVIAGKTHARSSFIMAPDGIPRRLSGDS